MAGKERHSVDEHRPEHTCCGVIEEAAHNAHEKRANRTKAQPWIVLKLMIGVTLGIMGYTAYVYIGRFCVGMIRRRNGAGGPRGTGIALLAVFAVLFLWMLWAYVKVTLTPPGFARDHVPQTSRPMFPEPQRPSSWNTIERDIEPGFINRHHQNYPSFSTNHTHEMDATDSIGGPSYENIPVRSKQESGGKEGFSGERNKLEDSPAGVLDALPQPITTHPVTKLKSKSRRQESEKYTPRVSRRPPTTPVLLPEHRYCMTDGIVKPYRTHHCRNCGTCILKYDHHCPWIGQCVGARNHKFFVNFLLAACTLTLYTFGSLLGFSIHTSNTLDGDIDPQEIVIIALAALFSLFTGGLLVSHVHLIWNGQTTVESMQLRTLKDKETRNLGETYGFCQLVEKRRTRKAWNEEWGTIDKEGNIWWLGSGKKGWVDVMGNSKWGWFLPIGRSLNDGLSYPINPRFDEQGRWRRRIEWPKELQ